MVPKLGDLTHYVSRPIVVYGIRYVLNGLFYVIARVRFAGSCLIVQ